MGGHCGKLPPTNEFAYSPKEHGLSDERSRSAAASKYKEAGNNIRLDRIAKLVTRSCSSEFSFVSIITNAQNVIGTDARGAMRDVLLSSHMPKSQTVCELLINDPHLDTLYIPDCRRDTRVANLPYVRDGKLVCYLGRILKNSEGVRVGTLCTIRTTVGSNTLKLGRLDMLADFSEDIMERLQVEIDANEREELGKQHSDSPQEPETQALQTQPSPLEPQQEQQQQPQQQQPPQQQAEVAQQPQPPPPQQQQRQRPEPQQPEASEQPQQPQPRTQQQHLPTPLVIPAVVPPRLQRELSESYIGVTPIDGIPHKTPHKYIEFEGEWMNTELAEDQVVPAWWEQWTEAFPRPPMIKHDELRIQQLERYHILGAEREDVFERLVEGAKQYTGVAIAFLSWHDANTQSLYCATSDAAELLPESTTRSVAVCNYTMKKRAPVVIPNMQLHPLFKDNPLVANGFRFYAGVPLINEAGWVVGTLCLFDYVPHYKFTEDMVLRMESMAELVMRQLEIRRIQKENEKLSLQHQRLYDEFVAQKKAPPEREVTMMFTDIQGSTALWEAFPDSMNTAQSLHDKVLREALEAHFGYEVTTEGDAFQVAFHTAFDALTCALKIQRLLLQQSWPADILTHPDAARVVRDGETVYNGVRVRMGLVTGISACLSKHHVTGRLQYMGSVVTFALALSECAMGGQILCCSDTWLQSELSTDVQVIDLGKHVLSCGPLHIMDVMPLELGCFQSSRSKSRSASYLTSPGGADTPVCSTPKARRDISCSGRVFEKPLKSLSQLSLSFWDAPRDEVVLVFMFVPRIKALRVSNAVAASSITDLICKVVRSTLAQREGYECQEIMGAFMLAFKTATNAIHWCFYIHQTLKTMGIFETLTVPKPDNTLTDHADSRVGIACGVNKGLVVDFRPHDKTGRMDYFGPVVNRTARLAASAHEGQTLVGEEALMTEECQESAFRNSVVIQDFGLHRLKGVAEPQHLYGLSPSPTFDESAPALETEFPPPKTLGAV